MIHTTGNTAMEEFLLQISIIYVGAMIYMGACKIADAISSKK